jgi:hypothetical protein
MKKTRCLILLRCGRESDLNVRKCDKVYCETDTLFLAVKKGSNIFVVKYNIVILFFMPIMIRDLSLITHTGMVVPAGI